MIKIIGIGEMAVSVGAEDILKTFALSSCVAVAAYSPRKKVSGLIHVVLPSAEGRQCIKPCYYADTGIPLLIKRMCALCSCKESELRISLYGGACSMRKDDVFNIGRMNLNKIKRVLSGMHLAYQEKDTGGQVSRTLEMSVETGNIRVFSQPLIL